MSYKKWVLIATLLFGVGLALGSATPLGIAELISEDIAALEKLSNILTSLPLYLVAIIIFINNAFTLLASFAFSPLLCIAPIFSLTVNGWLITFVSSVIIQEKSLGFLLAGLLPHGIFELPALILGQAAALNFGTMAILALFRRGKAEILLLTLKQDLKYLMLAIALLLPAAIIETYLTPLFLT